MFTIDLQIARPPGTVFAWLARIEDAPRWYSAVQAVEPVGPGPTRLGSRFRFRRQLGPMPVQNEVEVAEFDPDRILTLRSVSGPTPFRYRYVLEPSASGTLLRLHGEISGDGLPGLLSIVGGFAEPFFRRGMEANLRTLKGLIEGNETLSVAQSRT